MSATSAGRAKWPAPGNKSASEAAAPAERAVCVTTTRAPAPAKRRAVAAPDAAGAANDEREAALQGLRHGNVFYLIGGTGRFAAPGAMTNVYSRVYQGAWYVGRGRRLARVVPAIIANQTAGHAEDDIALQTFVVVDEHLGD